MSILKDITTEQLAKIEKKSLSEDVRPGYYDARSESQIGISDEMEAFLILLPDKDRSTLIDKIKTKYLLDEDRDDRVLEEFMENDYEDVSQLYYTLGAEEPQVGSFTKDLLSTMGSTDSLGALMFDVERGSNLTSQQRDTSFFRMVINRFIDDNRYKKERTQGQKEQAKSWISLLMKYSGG